MSTSHTSITIPSYQHRSNSPEFSDTLNNHLFITNVIPQTSSRAVSSEKSERDKNAIRCSLEELSKDIQEIEDFITVTEDIIKREKERDKEFYARERQRRHEEIQKYRNGECDRSNKENKSPLAMMQRKFSLKSPIYKINTAKYRKSKSGSPNKARRSRLYFKNGRIGCMDSDDFSANIQSTHQLVKDIIQSENNSPLVSPENVNRILKNCSSKMDDDDCDYCALTKSDPSLDNGSSEEIPLSKMFSKINLSKSDNSESGIVDSPIVEDEMIVAESPNMCCEDEARSFESMGDNKVPMPGSVTSIQSNVT